MLTKSLKAEEDVACPVQEQTFPVEKEHNKAKEQEKKRGKNKDTIPGQRVHLQPLL